MTSLRPLFIEVSSLRTDGLYNVCNRSIFSVMLEASPELDLLLLRQADVMGGIPARAAAALMQSATLPPPGVATTADVQTGGKDELKAVLGSDHWARVDNFKKLFKLELRQRTTGLVIEDGLSLSHISTRTPGTKYVLVGLQIHELSSRHPGPFDIVLSLRIPDGHLLMKPAAIGPFLVTSRPMNPKAEPTFLVAKPVEPPPPPPPQLHHSPPESPSLPPFQQPHQSLPRSQSASSSSQGRRTTRSMSGSGIDVRGHLAPVQTAIRRVERQVGMLSRSAESKHTDIRSELTDIRERLGDLEALMRDLLVSSRGQLTASQPLNQQEEDDDVDGEDAATMTTGPPEKIQWRPGTPPPIFGEMDDMAYSPPRRSIAPAAIFQSPPQLKWPTAWLPADDFP